MCSYLRDSILAGLPTTIELSGTSLITTEPAPIVTFDPIFIPPIIDTLQPIVTLSPIVGTSLLSPFLLFPITVNGRMLQFFPIFTLPLTIIPP